MGIQVALACTSLLWAAMAPAQTASQTELHISSEPPGAACSIDGTSQGVTPGIVSGLTPGQHLVVLTKSGFEEVRRTVTLSAGARSAIDEVLPRATGLLLLHTDPAGAEILIDGASRGRSPLLVTDLSLGRHRIRIEAVGCLPKELEVNLESRAPVKRLVELLSSTATLDVRSEPPGATITLDGTDQGQTPAILERVAAGLHTLRLTRDGYHPFEQSLNLSAGQEDSVSGTLTPIPATLSVVSVPEGARIYVDNEFRGIAPLTLEALPPGSYRVRAELRGHTIEARTVTLGLADTSVQEFRLASDSGTLELVTEPAGVTVYVDGERLGSTRFSTNATDRVSDPLQVPYLTEGEHTLQFSKQGYFSRSQKITIARDQTLTMHQTLTRRFIPDYEVVTAAGVDRGFLLEVDGKGNVKLEVRPGVIKTIPASDIRSGRPLREQELRELGETP